MGEFPVAIKKSKRTGQLVNFVLTAPLAIVMVIIGYYFGKLVGNFTTFPLYSPQSYRNLEILAAFLLIIQIFMRSIIFSTAFAVVFLCGIFYSWFGDWISPVIENSKDLLNVFFWAFHNRDIPYQTLIAFFVSSMIAFLAFVSFFSSLFIKFLFEKICGEDWGDGKLVAYIFGTLFLIVTFFGFSFYSDSIGFKERIAWVIHQKYNPLEEFCKRIPSAGMQNKDRVWTYDPYAYFAINPITGKIISEKTGGAEIQTTFWAETARPIIPTKKGLVAYDKDFSSEVWQCDFPASLPFFFPARYDTRRGDELLVPLLIRTDLSRNYILIMYDYGIWACVSSVDGKLIWTQIIDNSTRINKLSIEEHFKNPWVLIHKDMIIFSCLGGRIHAVNAKTGEKVWEFSSPVYRNQKPLRAFLSISGGKLFAAFPSGLLVDLDLLKGTKLTEISSVNRSSNSRFELPEWHPSTAVSLENEELSFLTEEGFYMRVRIDGGVVQIKKAIFEDKPFLMPIPMNLEKNFFAFKENLFKVIPEKQEVKNFFSFPKRVFATNPVVDGDFMYTGTQDGWVFCFQKESLKEIWRVHIGGELIEDSLSVNENGILVRTRSGSIVCLKKGI